MERLAAAYAPENSEPGSGRLIDRIRFAINPAEDRFYFGALS